MNLKQLAGVILLIASPILSHAAEKGTALKADTLRAEPYADSKTVGSLTRGDSVDIVSKKGAWLQVQSKKNSGWVRLLSVKRGGLSASGNSVSNALDVASGRAGTGKVVSTTGVRGLTAEDLKAAKFSEPEVNLLETYTIDATQAQKFAKQGGLKTTSVQSLNEVKQ